MVNKIKRYLLPFAVIFMGISFTGAYFSDSVSVQNNTFTAGTWTPGPAVISEVFYDPSGGGDSGLEWIEIKNNGSYSININNYLLHFATSGSNDFIFSDINLSPGQIVVVHVNTAGTDTSTNLFWSNTGGNNMGDSSGSISLFKNSTKNATNMVDFVQYGAIDQNYEATAVSAGIWADDTFVSAFVTGHSMELISSDNNMVSDWFDQVTPNPGV